ncbi:alpha/beta hydrolase [Carboxylicivirga sp. RSCT41]|uniref:alpha/beta hydrolase n=1 Tax=Carboxylicivirga agarovorans TaxID=3417570 RepID=UPI003D329108
MINKIEMLRIALFTGLLLLTGITSASQELRPLWAEDKMPYSKANDLIEEEKESWGTRCVFNVVIPQLYIYPAQGKNSGKAVIIIPGGGYEVEAIYHEGHDVARELAKDGITAAVLKYRLPLAESSDTPEKLPITDVQRALELMRQWAGLYGFETDNIGVMGFSAGGHLAAFACSKVLQRPNFSLIIYGCPRLSDENVDWLENKLFHRTMTEQEYDEFNILEQVNSSTPPSFLVHALDDKVCHYEETSEYAAALRRHNVAFELHTFPDGGHGFGLGDESNGTDQWIGLAIRWIKRL